MAKILILTLILCVAVATFALTAATETEAEASAPVAESSTATEPSISSTQAAPDEPTSTAAEPSTSSTQAAPDVPTSTAAEPSTSSTQAAPDVPTSTAAEPPTPAPGTTGSAATEPSTKGTPQTGVPTTVDPNASSKAPVTTATQAPATTEPPSVCASNPCRGGSTCEERAGEDFVCLCLTGDLYIGQTCVRGKVFPGRLALNMKFDPEMSNKKSQIFKETSEKITNAIDTEFKGKNEYVGSSVLELRDSKQSKARAETETGNVNASIEISYEPGSDITDKKVKEAIEKDIICGTCELPGTFTAESLCDSSACDNKTTTCESSEGIFECSCKDGLTLTSFSDRMCSGCPPGQKYENSGCVSCGFGYTGLNCKDNRILILVIVAPILGGLLIIALILLLVLTNKSKKKSSKSKDDDFEKPYHSHSVAKAPLSKSESNGYSLPVKESINGLAAGSGAPRIPRATTSNNWDSRTNLEMAPSNSRQNLISSGHNSRFDDNQDDMMSFSQSRPKNNPYEQIRPTSNPYAQNQSMNPYAQSRGQTNPYFN